MFSVTETEGRVAFRLSSELRLVDRVIQAVGQFLRSYDVDACPSLNLVLREMLNNAIEHGNRGDANRSVECDVTALGDRRFCLVVADQGPGFDHRAICLQLHDDPSRLRSRGFPLINAFADEMEFNESGNRITIYFSVTPPTSFEVRDEGDLVVVTPSGNLTAGVSEAFRQLLVGQFERDRHQFRFDFRQVADIDSVCLSVLVILAKMVGRRSDRPRLEIVNATVDMIDLFRLTQLDQLYRVQPV